MLKITDIAKDSELSREEMAGVTGGMHDLAALIDFSSDMINKVNDVNQTFAISVGQANTGVMANEQTFIGNNGLVYSPVTQNQTFENVAKLDRIGEVRN